MSAHHIHRHAQARHARSAEPGLSLLRLSAGRRLLVAAVLLAPFWLALLAVTKVI